MVLQVFFLEMCITLHLGTLNDMAHAVKSPLMQVVEVKLEKITCICRFDGLI